MYYFINKKAIVRELGKMVFALPKKSLENSGAQINKGLPKSLIQVFSKSVAINMLPCNGSYAFQLQSISISAYFCVFNIFKQE